MDTADKAVVVLSFNAQAFSVKPELDAKQEIATHQLLKCMLPRK